MKGKDLFDKMSLLDDSVIEEAAKDFCAVNDPKNEVSGKPLSVIFMNWFNLPKHTLIKAAAFSLAFLLFSAVIIQAVTNTSYLGADVTSSAEHSVSSNPNNNLELPSGGVSSDNTPTVSDPDNEDVIIGQLLAYAAPCTDLNGFRRENLALRGNAICDSWAKVTYNSPSLIIDGDYENRMWFHGPTEEDHLWFGIEFNEAYAMEEIVVRWLNYFPSKDGFTVEISNDGENWETTPHNLFRKEPYLNQPIDYIILTDRPTAKYIRLNCTEFTTGTASMFPEEPILTCVCVYELEIFESSSKDLIIKNGIVTEYLGNDITVTIPEGVTGIGENAFRGKTDLTVLNLPLSLDHVDKNAFDGCSSLKNIFYPGGIMRDKEPSVASGNEFFTSSTVTVLREYCGPNAYWTYDKSTCELTISGEGKIQDFSGDDEIFTPWAEVMKSIKKLTVNEGITHLGNYSFLRASSLTQVSLPSTLESIGIQAFCHCEKLKDLTIKSTSYTLGSYAFFNCNSLESFEIPYGTTKLNDCLFTGCSSLQTVIIPETVTSMGMWVFSGCNNLDLKELPSHITEFSFASLSNTPIERFVIPESMTEIPQELFSGCKNLKEVVFHDKVTTIGSRAFFECYSLKKISLPESITLIENSAFAYCTSLESINLENGIKEIGAEAFRLTALKEIVIPSTVTVISGGLFDGCSSLKSVILHDDITVIGWAAFRNCKSLTEIVLPKKITDINEAAFMNCTSLKSIIFPEELSRKFTIENYDDGSSSIYFFETFIGVSAFENCTSLTEICLPMCLDVIRDRAFYGCTRLEKITVSDRHTKTLGTPFSKCPDLTLYVQPNSLAYDYAYANDIPFLEIEDETEIEDGTEIEDETEN